MVEIDGQQIPSSLEKSARRAMMATLVIFIPDAAQPSQTNADNLTLITNSPELLTPYVSGLDANVRIAWTPEQHPVIRYINANGFNNHTAWVGIARNPRLNNLV
ncbi:hypothetical protein UF13_15390 [Pantoea agglomerans]|nr:hypothetical protein UF13_15390 [Pantoea agglomerans]